MTEGVYFVVNEDDTDTAPRQIFFNIKDAKKENSLYIDVFDKNGVKIGYFERENGDYFYSKLN